MSAQHAVIWPAPPRWTRSALIEQLRFVLQGKAEKAFLIGSHARGEATADSDIDLIVVVDTALPWPDRATLFPQLYQRLGAVDLLVYTPAEWADIRSRGGFVREALEQGVDLLTSDDKRAM